MIATVDTEAGYAVENAVAATLRDNAALLP